jgi:hypothetical protein
MSKGKLKQIRWRDSRMYITQCSKEDVFEVSEIYSVGYVVKEDKNSITLAGDVLNDGDVRRVIVIPKENIL